MAKYTTEVRTICEQLAEYTDRQGFDEIDKVIEKAYPKIFNFDFPIFDEEYRPFLEKKILKYYYLREIGAETVGVWKLFLCNTLNEVMPYFNQLYDSAKLEVKPFDNIDYIRMYNKKSNGNENGDRTTDSTENSNRESTSNYSNTDTANGTSKTTIDGDNTRTDDLTSATNYSETSDRDYSSTDRYSDTPQGALIHDDINDNTYLTNVRMISGDENINKNGNSTTNNTGTQKTEYNETNDNTNTNTLNSEGEGTSSETNAMAGNVKETYNKGINNVDDYIEKITGKMSNTSYSELLQKYRETFLNIDKMVIDSLADCFMLLW